MADETTNGGVQAPPPAGAKNTENMIPQSRFSEVIAEKNEALTQLANLKKQIEDMRAAQLAEKEDFKSLYEQTKSTLDQLQPKAIQVDEWKQALVETAQAQIELLPEEARALVPEYDDPRRTLDWLNKNAARLMRSPAPDMHAGPRGDDIPPETTLTALEEMVWKQSGLTREQFIRGKQQRATQDQTQAQSFLDRLRSMNQGE